MKKATKKAAVLLKKTQLFFLSLVLVGCQSFEETTVKPEPLPIDTSKNEIYRKKILGITIDDGWYEDISLEKIIKAIQKMPHKPTLRIVMSKEKPASDYVEMFDRLHQIAYIMATPVDSYEMVEYKTVADYQKRFLESYNTLKDYVDLWEIGNEINGEGWLGENPQLIVDKMIAAFELIDKFGAKTVLTAYYTKPKLQKVEMQDWLVRNLTSKMKENLDYLLVSYYEDDNEGYQPDWQSIFWQLEKDFPNIKIGIGECGSTNPEASIEDKIKKAKSYYSMPSYTKNYVGGYFWWYWVQDCIPYENNKIFQTINEAFY